MAAYYLDNDVAPAVALILRQLGHAATTAREVGSARAGDPEQLLVASSRREILVTHNARDFILLHQAWLRWQQAWGVSQPHHGILVIPQGPAEQNAARLARFVEARPTLENQLHRLVQRGGQELWVL